MILFSDQDYESKAFIETKEGHLVLDKLLSPKITRELSLNSVAMISCGFEHSIILTLGGQVASWGCGASGCLGHNNYLSYSEPKLILKNDFKMIRNIQSGGYHNAALDSDGRLFMWGRSDVGQLGFEKSMVKADESGYVVLEPQHVSYFNDIAIVGVGLGEAHSIVLDNKG